MSSSSDNSEASTDSWAKRREEARWNRFSTGMNRFHSWFKLEFNQLYELADGSFNQRGMSLSDYISSGEEFSRHLTMHHSIEEAHIFPFLATRMPAFAEDDQHKKSHKAIHDGLDNLKELIKRWRGDNTTYSPADMRGCLDGFKDVLMAHLDEEVEDLKAENMKKYWKLEELDVLPF